MTAKTSVDSPISGRSFLSDNGQLMAVSYLCVKNNQPASFMAFYNFGNTGQNQMDNQVSGYNYVGTLIPQVDYLSDAQALAFSDDGFLTYSGKQIPEESNQITLDDDILSVFHDDQYVGLAYKSGKKSSRMKSPCIRQAEEKRQRLPWISLLIMWRSAKIRFLYTMKKKWESIP